jgi:hypothetical protein
MRSLASQARERAAEETTAVPAPVEEAFRQRIRRDGVHRVWTGAVDNSNSPIITHQHTRYSALQVAWLLHHHTLPQGRVRSSCETALCVAGLCLSDEVSRQAEYRLLAVVAGIDLNGTCIHGHERALHSTVRCVGRRWQAYCRPCDRRRRQARKENP